MSIDHGFDPSDSFAPFGYGHGELITGVFAPIFDEQTLTDLPVFGRIPQDLNGVYLRNGPNPRFAPMGTYHPFDGDGMLHGVHFDKGKLTYRNKWIRTDVWREEDAAGRATQWGIRHTLKGRADKPLRDTCNTDVAPHAGKAVASWYMSGDAWVVDPITLETLEKARYQGLGGGVSAHFKVDERTGELMFFDYWNEAPYMSYGVVGPDGELRHQVPIPLPGPRLPHDMAITEHYSVLHDLPLLHDHDALKAGRHKLCFYPELKTRFGVIPRYGKTEEVRWFEFTPSFVYHVVNAWEEGDEVVMVACRYMPCRDASGAIDTERTAHNVGALVMDSRLWRYRMNLRTGEGHEEPLDLDHNVEFPSYNTRLTGRKTRYAYLVDHDPKILRWTGICKYDTDSGRRLGQWSDDPGHCWYSEPWFAQADNAAAEDHGYVIVFCWNDLTEEQQIQIFDACGIENGPIARVRTPLRIPSGFHGCWVPERSLPTRSDHGR